MKRNLNRKKFSVFKYQNLIYAFLIILTIMSVFLIYIEKNFILKIFHRNIEIFSKNFQYEYNNLNVSGLDKVEYSFLENKLKKYFKTSIFLLPLSQISNEIRENNWIKNVKLSTNYKDTLYINLEEYKPLGIYRFNKRDFYFDKSGKIIEEVNNKYNNNLIIFIGKSSNLNANLIIDILNGLNFQKNFLIRQINYIQKRRWDILINNDIKLMLSENDPKQSLQNFLIINKNLNETDMNNIEWIDLRDVNKTLINYYK